MTSWPSLSCMDMLAIKASRGSVSVSGASGTGVGPVVSASTATGVSVASAAGTASGVCDCHSRAQPSGRSAESRAASLASYGACVRSSVSSAENSESAALQPGSQAARRRVGVFFGNQIAPSCTCVNRKKTEPAASMSVTTSASNANRRPAPDAARRFFA